MGRQYHRIDDLEAMMEHFDKTYLLVEMVKYMSSDYAKEMFEDIRRNNGLILTPDGVVIEVDSELLEEFECESCLGVYRVAYKENFVCPSCLEYEELHGDDVEEAD